MITVKSAREVEAVDKAGDFLAGSTLACVISSPGVDMWKQKSMFAVVGSKEGISFTQIGVDGAMMDYPYAYCQLFAQ